MKKTKLKYMIYVSFTTYDDHGLLLLTRQLKYLRWLAWQVFETDHGKLMCICVDKKVLTMLDKCLPQTCSKKLDFEDDCVLCLKHYSYETQICIVSFIEILLTTTRAMVRS